MEGMKILNSFSRRIVDERISNKNIKENTNSMSGFC
jgi:hypothetical protein